MLIRVKLFAAMRDLTGEEVAEVELPDGATVGDLRRADVEALLQPVSAA